MRNGSVYLKSLFCLPALLIVIFISSCQKTSTTSSSDTGDWARKSEFEGEPRTQAVSFTIHYTAGGDTVYIGGGYNGNNRLNDFWKFDESKGTWYRVADFPGAARNAATAFSANGKGYVGTGFDGTNKLNDFWQYDPTTNAWTRVDDFIGTTRYGAIGFAISDKGYVGSGFDSSAWKKDFYQFDPLAASGSQWKQVSSLGGDKRTSASVFVQNNIAYVFGGVNNGSYLNDMWAYNAATDVWSEKRKITNVNDSTYDALYGLNIVRSNAACFLINDTAYLATGTYNGVIGSNWAYDIKNDQWFVKTAFEGPAREGAIGFTVNNHGYIATGDNGSNYYDDLWQFFPDATQTNDDN